MNIFKTKSLIGKLLVAMPDMQDSRFKKAVVYICAHSAEGAIGLIVNKPIGALKFENMPEQFNIKPKRLNEGVDVHFGGPVENGRGFILHSSDYNSGEDTLDVDDQFSMTASLNILEDIFNGNGPSHSLLAIGYAGWSAGQLESELQNNGWLITNAAISLVFTCDHSKKWLQAIKSIGIDPARLAMHGGRV